MYSPFAQAFFHGTKADLKIGDYIGPGFQCNYADRKLSHVYVADTLIAAIWGEEQAQDNENEINNFYMLVLWYLMLNHVLNSLVCD
ncbi:NAD(+)--rifampin ADP-ribosyltransferase [Pedobacter sp. KR3-3]|uniref:NAD(+)--rifampin ADP-ribosyltransferase n=1 Tax=Pedobacter albus TaxID=3113905 RepID=A0ABU7I3C6_9SPHI|nr:NAD(+)--rifampin ADP-ribosyltransferase [Pedobacter sp. KR3-3]MEE1943967.1 NAD(+)--rifampin ADP-ribosyltransferase [Pedobacter sp. KR3-3]